MSMCLAVLGMRTRCTMAAGHAGSWHECKTDNSKVRWYQILSTPLKTIDSPPPDELLEATRPPSPSSP